MRIRFLLVFLALISAAQAALPFQVAPRQLGLQISLTTSGYEFAGLSDSSTFRANVVLSNFSRQNISFEFPDAGAGAQRFVFRILDSTGTELWKSGAETVSAAVITPGTLTRKASWRRSLAIPLAPGGTPLPAGTYTLEAKLNATPSVQATTLFSVVTPGTSSDTGIKGQVLGSFAAGEPVPLQARIEIVEVAPTNVTLEHTPFTWSGSTDAAGFYQAATPAGLFRVTASEAPLELQRSILLLRRRSATALVTVTRGAFTQQSFVLRQLVIGPVLNGPNPPK